VKCDLRVIEIMELPFASLRPRDRELQPEQGRAVDLVPFLSSA